jgi:hypothetical protein
MALGEYRGPSSCSVFVRYALAKLRQHVIDVSYRTYVTDMLRNIPQMTYLSMRWADTVGFGHRGRERNAEEIVDHVLAGLGVET